MSKDGEVFDKLDGADNRILDAIMGKFALSTEMFSRTNAAGYENPLLNKSSNFSSGGIGANQQANF